MFSKRWQYSRASGVGRASRNSDCAVRVNEASVGGYIDIRAVGGSLKLRLSLELRLSIWWPHSGATYGSRTSASTNVRAVVIMVMAVEPKPSVVSESWCRIPCTASMDTGIVGTCMNFKDTP